MRSLKACISGASTNCQQTIRRKISWPCVHLKPNGREHPCLKVSPSLPASGTLFFSPQQLAQCLDGFNFLDWFIRAKGYDARVSQRDARGIDRRALYVV